ncbi:uncharacterized protein F5891DRAFT_978291 [Suillus fuscotomentosus]|uniref:Uncharacterized protein n=1 Tax=Suillus fuscotomentosus TaxID=1912939 RepID=A0AAD4HNI7_9AGAM|nr:uncharacterized protein F5891DRAFT_978291 [Suillus fuscotomentosus]KAG1902816.1 hypothetical protein F5891DRAFT_978291 [Suillus fuscotomentosus]
MWPLTLKHNVYLGSLDVYVNFEENITAKYGVVCEGWPLLKFCSPGDIGSHTEVKVLNSTWKTGTEKFQKMSKAEFKQRDKDRFQQKLLADSEGSANITKSSPIMEAPASVLPANETTSHPPEI